MAISNYSDLQSQIASYLARDDLTSQIPNFIQLTEAKLQRKFVGVTSLSSINTTNWMLTNNPDVYLYGALLEAQPYLMDDARIATWAEIYTTVVAQVRYPSASANFTNYSGLQAAIEDWINRSDLTDAIPNFIRLAEVKFSIKFKNFTPLSVGSPTNSILTNYPDIYLYGALVEYASYVNDTANLAIWEKELANRLSIIRVADSSSSLANYSGLQAALADWLERPDLSIEIPNFIRLAESVFQRKYADLTPLSVSSPTNWLLTSYPDLYLYGALLESAPYLKDDARLPIWQAEYDKRVSEVKRSSTSSGFINYTSFTSLVSDYLGRQDLTNIIPSFIQMAQEKLTRDLRTRPMLKVSTTTANNQDGTVELPTDFLEMRELHFQGNPEIVLQYQSPDLFFRNLLTDTGGTPRFYTLISNQLQFAPMPDGDLTLQMLYYAKPTFISSTTSSNLYLANYPDALLYATLTEAEPYLKNDLRIQTWAIMYDRAITNIMKSDDGSKYPNVPLNVVIR